MVERAPARLEADDGVVRAGQVAADLRSVNAQIDMLLRRALKDAGRLPADVRPARAPGRPRGESTS